MRTIMPDVPELPRGTDPAVSDIAQDLYDLHYEMAVLSWGCEQLWVHEFNPKGDMEQLSHFPVTVLNLLSSRVGEMRLQFEQRLERRAVPKAGLTKGGAQ